MRSEEVTALGDLAGEALAGVAGQARELHEAIANRVFTAVGPGAAPVRETHDRIARVAYASARGSVRLMVRAGARAVSATRPPDAPSLAESPAGRIAVGALNGAVGDTLRRRGNALALEMTVHSGGEDVAIAADAIAAAFPEATPRLAVFVHGLCETDGAWKLGHVRYGSRMEAELGYTPLYLRYNTGLHISENGRMLAGLLAELSECWPVEVHEIALIGHSMGGLVARSACHYGVDSDWPGKVRHVFTLAAPHRGAPLEKAANAAGSALRAVPETRLFAHMLNRRSAGIKDLRYGYLVDECWVGQDCDAFLRNTGREIPFLRTANHYFVCATLTRSAHAPVGRILGDSVVLRASAWDHVGRGERMRFPVHHYRHVGGANHFDLLGHPAIYEQIARWLAGERALPAPQRP
jgi:pimeloyl-ACP methyl ester carboxylesterase